MSNLRFSFDSYGDLKVTIPREMLGNRDLRELNDVVGYLGGNERPISEDDIPYIPPWRRPLVRRAGEDDPGGTNFQRDRKERQKVVEERRKAEQDRIEERREQERQSAEERANRKREEANQHRREAEAANRREEEATIQADREAAANEKQAATRKANEKERDANNILMAEDKRDHIRTTARSVVEEDPERLFNETGGYRNWDAQDEWEAHERGAIDFRSKDVDATTRHTEAKKISQRLGDRYIVLVEEVDGDSQLNTPYRGGVQRPKPYVKKPRTADGTHTHVGPDRWW